MWKNLGQRDKPRLVHLIKNRQHQRIGHILDWIYLVKLANGGYYDIVLPRTMENLNRFAAEFDLKRLEARISDKLQFDVLTEIHLGREIDRTVMANVNLDLWGSAIE